VTSSAINTSRLLQAATAAWAPVGWARGGTYLALEMLQSVLCLSTYSKSLSRRIIYALFSQQIVGFWGLCCQTLTGALFLDSARGLLSPDP